MLCLSHTLQDGGGTVDFGEFLGLVSQAAGQRDPRVEVTKVGESWVAVAVCHFTFHCTPCTRHILTILTTGVVAVVALGVRAVWRVCWFHARRHLHCSAVTPQTSATDLAVLEHTFRAVSVDLSQVPALTAGMSDCLTDWPDE